MPQQTAFVGSWWATVVETDGPPTRALFTFGAGGTLATFPMTLRGTRIVAEAPAA